MPFEMLSYVVLCPIMLCGLYQTVNNVHHPTQITGYCLLVRVCAMCSA
jgi:hypothetical protein